MGHCSDCGKTSVGPGVRYLEGKIDCFDSVRLNRYCCPHSCAIRYGSRWGKFSKEKGAVMDHTAIAGEPHLTNVLRPSVGDCHFKKLFCTAFLYRPLGNLCSHNILSAVSCVCAERNASWRETTGHGTWAMTLF